jgi:hypothetical protein
VGVEKGLLVIDRQISELQRARKALRKLGGEVGNGFRAGRRRMTAAGRAAISRAQKARWSKLRLVKKKVSHDKRALAIRGSSYGATTAASPSGWTTYLEAVELQRAALAAGWQTAKIFDTTLSEVTERPEDKKKPRPVVN